MKLKHVLFSMGVGLGLTLTLMVVLSMGRVWAAPAGETYYVSPSGSNLPGNGSRAKPWKTIGYAVSQVPAGKALDLNIIRVEAGTYSVPNGEKFPIVFANPYVGLVGAGSLNTVIEGDGAATSILSVTIQGIGITGFRIQGGNDTAIASRAPGLTVHDNVIRGVANGIKLAVVESLTDDFTAHATRISDNTIAFNKTGLSARLDLDGQNQAWQVNIGTLDVSGNTFNDSDANDPVIDLVWPTLTRLISATVNVGDLSVEENTIDGGATGLRFEGSIDMLTDTVVSVGDVVASDNVLTNQTGDGIILDYYGGSAWYGDCVGGFGRLLVTGNEIASGSDGIEVSDFGPFDDLHGSTSITTLDALISGNTVSSGGDGINIFYDSMGYYVYDTSAVSLGRLSVQSNTIDAVRNGIWLYLDYLGADMYGDTTFSMAGVVLASNAITAEKAAMGFSASEVGVVMEGTASATLGETTIQNNTIWAAGDHAINFYYSSASSEMSGSTRTTLGDVTIAGNTVAGDRAGVIVEDSYGCLGVDNSGSAEAVLSDWIVSGNTFDVGGNGFHLEFYYFADDLTDNAVVRLGGVSIDDNTFTVGGDGIFLANHDGCDTDNNSLCTTGAITITNNRVSASGGDGISVVYGAFPGDVLGSSRVESGEVIVSGNVMTDVQDGIYVGYDYIESFDNATAVLGAVEISDNEINNASAKGIYLYHRIEPDGTSSQQQIGGAVIAGNIVSGCVSQGVHVQVAGQVWPSAVVQLGDTMVEANRIENCHQGIAVESNGAYTNSVGIANNTVGSSEVDGIFVDYGGSAVDVFHNTVVRPAMSTDGTAVHVTSGTVEVANNILLFHVTGIGVDAGAVSEDYNLFYGTGLDTKVVGPVTSGGHSWSEDPELVDLSGGDYHILASSPAKDAAPCVGTRFDFDGDPRPVTAGCDIGADEYQVKVYLPLILR